METIRIRGARTHNLKNINLDLPRDQLIVITGPPDGILRWAGCSRPTAGVG